MYFFVVKIYKLSFTKWQGSIVRPQFIGLQNYQRIIHDTMFFQSIKNTAIMWIINIIPQIVVALFLAVILNERKIKGKGILRSVYYLPNLVTMASVSVLFSFILDWKTGSLNRILQAAHIINQPINWLQDITAARGAVAFINWWMWFGYSMIIFMAGIKAIPDELNEAAIVDGANKWQTFKNITLPLIRPTMLYIMITSLIGGMAMFDVPYVLTNGEGAPQNSILTMVMYLYNTAFKNRYFGYGATVGVALFILMSIAVSVAYKFINRKSLYD
ncbi:carbohydrate ABC transporter permease [Clostridium oryzae]|uniref:Lactose transport system permease protein LacF n=1 Tax=Clostridium oryzae TaxID=1450648 RepID=A0A1V4INC2_9CLOT|nr:sugar ABC transporter permease [Clostridium oryzae]OPJ61552.1 lactose transport system permease protein LacF [Clostridium oryzae]